VAETAQARGLSMRDAAMSMSIRTVASALAARGSLP
jgi:hypothetical protein